MQKEIEKSERNNTEFRILQLTSSSDIGGTERMVLQFLKSADRSKFSYTVFSVLGSGIVTKECRSLGINAETFGIRKPQNLLNLLKLIKEIKKGRFHIIHSYGLRADLTARLFAGKWNIKYPILVSGIRSIDPHRTKLQIYLDRITSKKTSLFISNSEAGKQIRIEREKFPADKIITIHNGIEEKPADDSQKKIEIKKRLGFKENEIIIGHISNIRKMKGHEEILRAAVLLKDEFPDIRFIFAGRDDSLKKIPNLSGELGVNQIVTFMGFVENPDYIYGAIDIFILPSHWEGFPTSILEAMQHSLPVIASNVGGIPEMIKDGDNGILIPPKNPEALANAIKMLLVQRDLRDKIRQNAYRTVCEKFLLSQMTIKIEEQYKKLLGI